MKKTFYCPICKEFRDGKVIEVVCNRVTDITHIYCPHCGQTSVAFLAANTIPKITFNKSVGEGEE